MISKLIKSWQKTNKFLVTREIKYSNVTKQVTSYKNTVPIKDIFKKFEKKILTLKYVNK